MHEKRNWPKLGIVLFGCLVCVVLWQIFASPRPSADISALKAAYTLFTKNSTGFQLQPQLPDTDYNQLIDLEFNFSMLNLVCNETSPLLLVLVHSSPQNFAKRKTLRETWGRSGEHVKVLYLIGSVNSSDLQRSLEDENMLHNDFVQGSFLDTYRNITYKHVMAFKYVIYHCPQAKYVLKTDDDVFVNMPAMKNFLNFDLSPYGARSVLFCTVREHPKVLRSYRSKWRVSFAEYPHRNYPTYCPGWTLLYSPDVIFALYKEAQKAAYFWIDDIHITGTLVEKINLTHTDIEFLVITQWNLNKIVDYSWNVTQPFLYGKANLKEREIRGLWKYVSSHPAPKYIFNISH